MKNMNTTLEIPEGSKATIQGKVIEAYCTEIFVSLENSVKNTNKNENW